MKLGGRFVEIAGGGRELDAAEVEHHILEHRSRAPPLSLTAGDGRVPVVGELLDQLAQFVVDGIHGQRDDVDVMRRNGGVQNADEIADLLELNADPVDDVGPLAVADGIQIGDQIALILRPRGRDRTRG